MAGLFSILLVLLVMVGPVYLAGSLEDLETASPNIYSYEEIASSTIEQNIIPWWQFCNETSIPEDDETIITDSGAYFWYSEAPSNLNPLSSSWDLVGYWDYFMAPGTPDGSASLILKGDVSASSMLTAGVYDISFGIDYSGDYTILDFSWFYGFSYFTVGWQPVTGSDTWMFDTFSGLTWFNLTVTNQELIDASTTEGMYSVYGLAVTVTLSNGYETGDIIKTNFRVNPEYLIVHSTVAGNTTFKSYEVASSHYNINKIMMGIGGILVIITGLIASPLPIGEAFDSFFPINNHVSGSTRKRTKRGRRK
jgi:hypothetical protein